MLWVVGVPLHSTSTSSVPIRADGVVLLSATTPRRISVTSRNICSVREDMIANQDRIGARSLPLRKHQHIIVRFRIPRIRPKIE